jgi:hypothetical protein
MPKSSDPEHTRLTCKAWRAKNRERVRANKRAWYARNAKKPYRNCENKAAYQREMALKIKIEVLTHYGPSNNLRCCWPDCKVTDTDILSLDHVADDGAIDRKVRGAGHKLYLRLRRDDYPSGFQTLCANHQTKKEMLRRRAHLT